MTEASMATRIETYIPLYRKYRPQAFSDVVGQEAIVQTLGNAINLNKVAHAYLFCGPRGTGKTSTARIFAKSLNCEQGPTVSPCLQCASCTGIAQGNALDVVEFDAASHTSVDDARELIENAQYTAMSGRFKIYIIDEVHMLSKSAFNALLKTLEEPPPNVVFIFATTEAHKVLPTIISRCQRFDFNRITSEDITARLRYIAAQEQITIDDEALLMIARHARGGLRDAVGLLDQVSVLGRAQADKVINRKDVALFIGTIEEDLLLRLSKAIAERRAADLLRELGELLNRGVEPIQLLKDLTVHFRNLLLVQATGTGANPDQLDLPPDYFAQLAEQVALFPEPEELPQLIGRLASVERNIRNGNQPQLWLEVGLIELAYRYEIELVKDLSERVSRLEAQLSGQAPVASRTMPQPSARPAPVQSMPQPVAQAAPVSKPISEPIQISPAAPPSVPIQASPSGLEPVQPEAPATTSAPMGEPPPVASAPAAPVVPVAPVDIGGLEADFNHICNLVAHIPTRSRLQQQAFLVRREGDLVVIGCVSDPILNALKSPERLPHIQQAVSQFYGQQVRTELIVEKREMKKPTPVAPPVSTPVSTATPAPEPVLATVGAAPIAQAAASSLVSEMIASEPTTVEPASAVELPFAGQNMAVSETSPELSEAKKHAVELLQGKILD